MSSPTVSAVLVAAGNSTRMGGGERKPWRSLRGRPLLWHTVRAFDATPAVTELVIVAHADDLARIAELGERDPVFAKLHAVVPGGAERTDSVRAGVEACSAGADILLVHDAARALIEPEIIARAVATAARSEAALVAVPVRDTQKRANDAGHAVETLSRERLWSAQTPQAFRAARLREAIARAAEEDWTPTDDAALYERYFGPVPIVEGSPTNLKVTTPEDLLLAEAILAQRESKQ